jgi:hypothetical protein
MPTLLPLGDEVRSVALYGAVRSCDTVSAPISLSSGFVSRDPISYPPPYALRLRGSEPVRVVRVALAATSLPVTLTFVTALGVRSAPLALEPGEYGDLTPGVTVPADAIFALEVTSITKLRSLWRFSDRVRLSAHFFSGGDAAPQAFVKRLAPIIHDRLARPILAVAHPVEASVTIAYTYIDSNPLTLRRCQVTSEPLAAFGTMTLVQGAFTSNATVTQETFVDGISPDAIDFATDAVRVERNEGVEACLRALGDLSDTLSRALAGSGAPVATDDVNQSTFVQSHQGFVRAIAAASMPAVQPLVDASDAPPDALFPVVDGVQYIRTPPRTLRVSAPTINMLPPLDADLFDLEAVRALVQLTTPFVPIPRASTTGVFITRLTPEYTLDASVRLRTEGGAVAVRVPVGDPTTAAVSVNLADGQHALDVVGYGFIPVEVTSSVAHGDAFVFRGRLGLVVPPIVGAIVGTATHTARVHVFHSELVPAGELRVRWMHQPASIYTGLTFPLAASASLVLARDSAVDLPVERRLGVPIAQYSSPRTIVARPPRVGQQITLALWLFVDGDARLDTWRAPLQAGVLLSSTEQSWCTVSISGGSAADLQLGLASDLTADEAVSFPLVRDRWVFVCVRPHVRRACVAHAGGFYERAINVPLRPTHSELKVHTLRGVHVRALTTWDAHLDDETVRTLCDARVGPRMRYDRVDLPMEWLAAPTSQVGIETRLLIEGPPATAFEVAHASLVWYRACPPPPQLLNLTQTSRGVTIAVFSDTVVLAYAEGQGLIVLSVDQHIATLLGNVQHIPAGSFFSPANIPILTG